jgi:hypothetical protein
VQRLLRCVAIARQCVERVTCVTVQSQQHCRLNNTVLHSARRYSTQRDTVLHNGAPSGIYAFRGYTAVVAKLNVLHASTEPCKCAGCYESFVTRVYFTVPGCSLSTMA